MTSSNAVHGLRLQLRRTVARISKRRIRWGWYALRAEEAVLAGDRRFLLLEYPKCGRTWLRYMISQAEAAVCGVPMRNTLSGVWYPSLNLPRVHYAHGFSRTSAQTSSTGNHEPIGIHDFRRRGYRGFLFLVRQPERVMASYYYHCRYRSRVFGGSPSEFIRHPDFGIQNYVTYVEFYLPQLRSARGRILTYESIKKDPVGRLNEVLGYLELSLPVETVEQIVRESSLSRMKSHETTGQWEVSWLSSSSSDPRGRKVRSGGTDPLEDLFTNDDLDFIRRTYLESAAFRTLGYTASRERTEPNSGDRT